MPEYRQLSCWNARREILQLIKSNPQITMKLIVDILNLSPMKVHSCVQYLISEGKISPHYNTGLPPK
jgi:DeoR/GlpR family transcriptional regulator of sugar metabolism